LIHSELGEYFRKSKITFNLVEVIKQRGIVYFALPALRFPNFSKILGKLVINDLKSVIDRLNSSTPIFTVFDEFSVFAATKH
jgi:conjugal transfer pilus assembly protein TraD